MSQQNVEAVRRQHEHFSRTGEVLSEIYQADAEWMAAREDPDAATHRGLEAIQRYFAQWLGMFEDTDFRAEELIDSGDKVFAWIRFSGKGTTSGVPVEMELAQIWTFRGGRGRNISTALRPSKQWGCRSKTFTPTPRTSDVEAKRRRRTAILGGLEPRRH
jgi:ketosteroid isomerase-like protein